MKTEMFPITGGDAYIEVLAMAKSFGWTIKKLCKEARLSTWPATIYRWKYRYIYDMNVLARIRRDVEWFRNHRT